MFQVMWNNFYNTCVRNVPVALRGGIIFLILMSALICFIFAIKDSKKDKMVKNWFLFFLAIILTAVGIFYSVI